MSQILLSQALRQATVWLSLDVSQNEMHTLTIPSPLRLKEALEFSRKVQALEDGTDVALDFCEIQKAGPFALLLISSAVQRAKDAKPNIKFHPRNYAQHSYLCHMGFFRAMGIQYGKLPGAAHGSDSYLPVTIQEVVSIRRESKESGVPIGELVEADARALAEVLTRSRSGAIFEVLSFTLREIIRNTVEHSKSPSIEWCAQYWPNMDKVEIAVLDRGIGIHKSLLSNPSLSIQDEKHAINLALLPGISCNVRLDQKPKTFGVWQNSGFGLFMTQRLCRLGGDFFIASGKHGKYLQNEKSRWFDYGFDGTAIRLVLRPSSIGNLKAALSQYNDDALRIAKANNITIPNASTASRMIRLEMYE